VKVQYFEKLDIVFEFGVGVRVGVNQADTACLYCNYQSINNNNCNIFDPLYYISTIKAVYYYPRAACYTRL